MRKYELMTVFPIEEAQFKQGIEEARSVLGDFNVQIDSEDPFGDRELTYEIKKRGAMYCSISMPNRIRLSK